MQHLQEIMDAAEAALLRDARDVFGSRVYPDRVTPFDPGPAKRVLPSVCVYAPEITYSTEGKPLERGRFMFTKEHLVLEVWARVDPGDYKDANAHGKAQAAALRGATQVAVDALFRSNDLMRQCSQVPQMEVRLGADMKSQARVDASMVTITLANQGLFAARVDYDAVPLKAIYLGLDLKDDPNQADAVDARYLKLDQE